MVESEVISAPELLWKLSEETGAFRVDEVVPTPRVGSGRGPLVWDFAVRLSVPGGAHGLTFYIETRTQLTPQTALQVADRMGQVPPDGGPLVVTPFVSPRVAEIFRDHGVSYLDGVGNCRISGPGLFIHVQRPRTEPAPARPLVDPFARKSSRVVRVLLSRPGHGWQVQALAREAGVSLGLASKVKAALVRDAYLDERERLLYVREPAKLLRQWAEHYHPPGKKLSLFTLARPGEAEANLARWCAANGVPYALTQLAGAWRVAPMVRYDRSAVYVSRQRADLWSLDSLTTALAAKRVETGANLDLWLTDDAGVFYGRREVGGVSVASPVQLFLDLRRLSGRGREAAEEVFEREIRPVLEAGEAAAP